MTGGKWMLCMICLHNLEIKRNSIGWVGEIIARVLSGGKIRYGSSDTGRCHKLCGRLREG